MQFSATDSPSDDDIDALLDKIERTHTSLRNAGNNHAKRLSPRSEPLGSLAGGDPGIDKTARLSVGESSTLTGEWKSVTRLGSLALIQKSSLVDSFPLSARDSGRVYPSTVGKLEDLLRHYDESFRALQASVDSKSQANESLITSYLDRLGTNISELQAGFKALAIEGRISEAAKDAITDALASATPEIASRERLLENKANDMERLATRLETKSTELKSLAKSVEDISERSLSDIKDQLISLQLRAESIASKEHELVERESELARQTIIIDAFRKDDAEIDAKRVALVGLLEILEKRRNDLMVIEEEFMSHGIGMYLSVSDTDIVGLDDLSVLVTDIQKITNGVDASVSYRFVSDVNLHCHVHSIAVVPGDKESCDMVAVVFRHAIVSVLQFDASVNQFKSVGQQCFASDVGAAPSSSFVSKFSRVYGDLLVTQFTPQSLTFVHLGAEISSFSIPVKLSATLNLASVDDVQFLASKTGSVAVVVLGKKEPHAWVGRTATMGSQTSVVRMLSVDVAKKAVTLNWSFEELPTSAFRLQMLPAPKGGFLVVSPDSVSYCEEFSSRITLPVNEAGGDDKPVHFLHPEDVFDIDLTRSEMAALSDELVVFACSSGDMLACHLVRQSGAFNSVSELVWERLDCAVKTRPSCLTLACNGRSLFVSSRQGTSLLYRISQLEILLPIGVFKSSAEEMRLVQLEQSLAGDELAELVHTYQREVHDGKISHSIELGLADELVRFGSILGLESDPDDGRLLATTSSGDLVSVWSQLPVEVIFELQLKNMKFLLYTPFSGKHVLVLASGTQTLLIDCGNSIRELGRVSIPGIVGIVQRATDDGKTVILTSTGIVTVALVTAKTDSLEVNQLTEWDETLMVKSCAEGDHIWLAVQSGMNAINVMQLSCADGSSLGQHTLVLPEGREVTSVSLSVTGENALLTTVSDSAGSLYVFFNDQLQFCSRFASICQPLLVNEDPNSPSDGEYVLSITDPSKRPLEANTAVSLFASKVRISEAKIESVNGKLILVILVENRPVMVYMQTQADRFVLLKLDAPYIHQSGAASSVVPVADFGGHSGLIVAVSQSFSLFLTVSDRGQLFAHPLHLGASAVCAFASEYVASGLASLEVSRAVSTLRFLRFRPDVDVHARFPVTVHSIRSEDEKEKDMRFYASQAVASKAGLAVACISDEVDPGLVVPLPPTEMDEMEAMDGGPTEPEQPQAMLVSCPVPPRRQKHHVRVMHNLETVSAIIDLQPNEMVTGLVWADSVLGLGPDVLIIGTTWMLGEETPAQGRLMVVRVDYAPGVTPPPVALEEDSVVAGGKVLFDSVKRTAVTVVKAWRGCVAVGLGHRLMMYQWDGVAGRLRGVGMIDLGLQITSLSFFKNFIVAGDILRGVYLLRYKEDPVMDAHGNVTSMAASIQLLGKSFPLQNFSAVNVETIREDSSVGIVSVDTYGNLDLEVFSPVHFGQFLRHSVPFQLPSRTVALLPANGADKGLIIGTAAGSLCHIIPVKETEHHLAASLVGLMTALLPQAASVNPRLHHVGVGREAVSAAAQTIESIDPLVDFLYLATPLQAEIASRMKQPVDVLTRTVAQWLTPILP